MEINVLQCVTTFHPLLVHPCSFLTTTMLLPHFPQQLHCVQYLMFTIHIPHCFLIYAMSFSSISSMHSCNLVFSRPLIGTKLYYLKHSWRLNCWTTVDYSWRVVWSRNKGWLISFASSLAVGICWWLDVVLRLCEGRKIIISIVSNTNVKEYRIVVTDVCVGIIEISLRWTRLLMRRLISTSCFSFSGENKLDLSVSIWSIFK